MMPLCIIQRHFLFFSVRLFLSFQEYINKKNKIMTRIIFIDDKSLHIEGFKHIIVMETDYIIMQCGRRKLKIAGKNLKIELLSEIELNINGMIVCVEWVK